MPPLQHTATSSLCPQLWSPGVGERFMSNVYINDFFSRLLPPEAGPSRTPSSQWERGTNFTNFAGVYFYGTPRAVVAAWRGGTRVACVWGGRPNLEERRQLYERDINFTALLLRDGTVVDAGGGGGGNPEP